MFFQLGFRLFQGRFRLINGSDHLIEGLRQAADLIFGFNFNLIAEIAGFGDDPRGVVELLYGFDDKALNAGDG